MKLDKFTVGKRYGKALFEAAVEANETQAVYDELCVLREVYREMPELGTMLSDRCLTVHEKQGLVDQLLVKLDVQLVQQAIKVMHRYERMNDLPLIIDEYERRYDELNGVLLGKVTTAVPLNEAQATAIAEQVAQRFGYKTAELTNVVDPTVIGGVIVEANHCVIDGSLQKRLADIQAQLLKN